MVMKPTVIPLKEPDAPPKKWWALFAAVLFLGLGYLVVQRLLTPQRSPDDIISAEIVDSTPEMQWVPRGGGNSTSGGGARGAGGVPSVLVKVEPGADRKSDLFPNAITNYFEEFPPETAQHPLDPALEVAQTGLDRLQTIKGYQAEITKRERLKGTLAKAETMEAKIRRPIAEKENTRVPFSVYLRFLSPKSVAGREVLWVEGRDQNKMLVREAGLFGVIPLSLPPDGMLAMSGSRYPIWEIGFDVLIKRMIEKGTRDRKIGDCLVRVDRWVELDGRPCTLIAIEHPEFREGFDFHKAGIVIDDELNIPIHYAAYDFPETEGGRPLLLEQYTYRDVVLDIEFTETDFDRNNPEYGF